LASRFPIRRHGGRIEIDTDVGRGSRFTVHIPLQQPRRNSDIVQADEAERDSAAVPGG